MNQFSSALRHFLFVFSILLTLVSCGGGHTSNPHRLSLTSQPRDTTVNEGDDQTFSLAVAHNYPVAVSWFKDGTQISGASGASYSLTGITADDAATYGCSVTDGELTVDCSDFTLTVRARVTITEQPSDQSVNVGDSVSFTVSATGTPPLSYQWYHDNQAISGATGASLSIASAALDDAGNYHCMVSNGASPATSATARLYVVGSDVAFTLPNQGLNEPVNVVVEADDGSGDVYLGGEFTIYNDARHDHIIRFNSDGTVDDGFVTGNGFDDSVLAIAPAGDGTGDIYVFGSFAAYNGTAIDQIVRLHSDGSVDSGFVLGAYRHGHLMAIASPPDGSGGVYVSGFIWGDMSDSYRRNVYRFESDGSLDNSFSTGATEFDRAPSIIAPARDGSGDIYLGGDFFRFDNTDVGSIVRFESSGSLDTAFDAGTGFDGVPTAILPTESGEVYAGGHFTSYNGNPINHIIRLHGDGSVDTAFAVGSGFDDLVTTLAPAADGSGDVYAGGSFSTYQDVTSNYFVRLHANGAVDNGFLMDAGFNGQVVWAAPTSGGSGAAYIAGFFASYNGTFSPGFIRLAGNGSISQGYAENLAFDGPVDAVAPALDGSGDIYVGGGFAHYNGISSKSLVRLMRNGTVESDFATDGIAYSEATRIAPATDGSGDLYAAVSFFDDQDVWTNEIVRLNDDGSLDSGFSPVIASGQGYFMETNAIAVAVDGSGDLYIGGEHTHYRDIKTNHIVRVNSDGMIDSGFDMGSGFNGDVEAITPVGDGSGDIYVGGSFTTYDGVESNRIIRLDSDGTPDAGFAVGSGFDGVVNDIRLVPGDSGDIYVCGGFNGYNGSASNRIMRLHSNGSVDDSLAVGDGFDDSAYRTIAAPDSSGDIYVLGRFSSYNGTVRRNLIRLHSNGSVDDAFDVGAGFGPPGPHLSLAALAAAGDGSGTILVGGNFSSYQDTTVMGIIALSPDGSIH